MTIIQLLGPKKKIYIHTYMYICVYVFKSRYICIEQCELWLCCRFNVGIFQTLRCCYEYSVCAMLGYILRDLHALWTLVFPMLIRLRTGSSFPFIWWINQNCSFLCITFAWSLAGLTKDINDIKISNFYGYDCMVVAMYGISIPGRGLHNVKLIIISLSSHVTSWVKCFFAIGPRMLMFWGS